MLRMLFAMIIALGSLSLLACSGVSHQPVGQRSQVANGKILGNQFGDVGSTTTSATVAGSSGGGYSGYYIGDMF